MVLALGFDFPGLGALWLLIGSLGGTALHRWFTPYLDRIRPTPSGWLALAQWDAYRGFLGSVKRDLADEDGQNLFELHLAFAYAAGLGSEWLKAARKAGLMAPRWFMEGASLRIASDPLKRMVKEVGKRLRVADENSVQGYLDLAKV
jgi:hypothetical protein